MNSNFSILIPKVDSAATLNKYKTIILGDFFFEIIFKIISDRLASVVSRVVSLYQFGFIWGSQIWDCIAAASDCVKILGLMVFGGNMALKIDIKKAFDTLNWDFILIV